VSIKSNSRSNSAPASTPIPFAEFWNKSKCAQCGSVIRRGAPRCLVLFAELGIGPGSRAYQDDEEYGLDEDKGLIMDSSATIAMCRPCASDFADLKIENPWFALREERAADDPGGSVFAIPVSQLNISSGDVADDYVADGDVEEGPAAAQNDATDRFFSVQADKPVGAPLTGNDYRAWMRKFLTITDSRAMTGEMRRVCELWAAGKKQADISEETGISQATVSRIIRDGKDLLYSHCSRSS
jgi:hypothetical protein